MVYIEILNPKYKTSNFSLEVNEIRRMGDNVTDKSSTSSQHQIEVIDESETTDSDAKKPAYEEVKEFKTVRDIEKVNNQKSQVIQI